MAGILEGVDRRTQLAGHNRFELLLFTLTGKQRYGINVFKVKEVIQCPSLTQIPNSHSVICGVAHLRGKTIPVLDLAMAIGLTPMLRDGSGYVIVTEYNRTIQGFLVRAVDRIINIGWDAVKAPPKGISQQGYLTAVTELDNELIEVVDVEKVMKEVIGLKEDISSDVIDQGVSGANTTVLIVDDSSVARNQIKRVCQQLGVACVVLKDGQEALDHLTELRDQGSDVGKHYAMLISDVEMPRMDGYTLTSLIRKDAKMRDLYVILHTSLSGVFNTSMVDKVGANEFLAKFDPDYLAKAVQNRLRQIDALTVEATQ
ncbi:MAG: chemotaxis protein CheV [Methylococcales bacterium]|nr:chemotaxis protein CheV [Methylococcales bacterium]